MKITVEAAKTDDMYLRQQLATATLPDGTEIEVCSIIPDGSLLFKIGKDCYVVQMRSLLDAILEKRDKGKTS